MFTLFFAAATTATAISAKTVTALATVGALAAIASSKSGR